MSGHSDSYVDEELRKALFHYIRSGADPMGFIPEIYEKSPYFSDKAVKVQSYRPDWSLAEILDLLHHARFLT